MDRTATNVNQIGKGRKAVLPPDGQKWTQEEARYKDSEQPGGCARCSHFDRLRNQCEIVAGAIQADACCDFFNDDPGPPPPVSKYDSGYVRVPGAQYLCGDCVFFDKNGGCQIVEGPISAGGACWEWNNQPGNDVGPNEIGENLASSLPTRQASRQPPIGPPPPTPLG